MGDSSLAAGAGREPRVSVHPRWRVPVAACACACVRVYACVRVGVHGHQDTWRAAGVFNSGHGTSLNQGPRVGDRFPAVCVHSGS